MRTLRTLLLTPMLLGALLGTVACSLGGGSDAGSPTATPAVGPDGSATPAAVLSDAPTVEVRAAAEPLPGTVALILARDGELWRVHRGVGGELEERLLFDPFAYAGNQLLSFQDTNHLGATLPPGQLVIAVCTTGECPGSGASGSIDAVVTFFRSDDGGVTWESAGDLDGIATVVAGRGLDSFLLERLPRTDDSRTGRIEWWPSGLIADPPATRDPGGDPITLGAGTLGDSEVAWWTTEGALVTGAGSTLLDLGAELSGGSRAHGVAVLPNVDATRLAVTWIETLPDGDAEAWRWSIYDRLGASYAVSTTLAAPFKMIPTAWLSSSTLLVNGDVVDTDGRRRIPLILDVTAHAVTPIDLAGFDLEGGWAVAVQLGPFAEINAGAGDCLNLRSEGSSAGRVLRCIADGALVERLSPLEGEWVNVRTADGRDGWISGEFVR
ncbi:MAG: SH3 domain-containing protein [Chloroflexi bacterium]|nr:SH3 domain-containing protein [Chloroflexota bacterium]MDA1146714.1 SH3 domain-containing protein [Chloroflexota bacterium]